MRILMLGWEYPPHIAGGLGVACEGLARSLSSLDLELTFVVPKLFGDEDVDYMNLITPEVVKIKEIKSIRLLKIPTFLQPYFSSSEYRKKVLFNELSEEPGFEAHYGNDLFSEVDNYTFKLITALSGEDFDVIHAHDWMTFPGAMGLSKILNIPYIAHLHSLEADRSGGDRNYRIQEIEKTGLGNASQVIAVSNFTKNLICSEYGIDSNKISVIYNGISSDNRTGYVHKEEPVVMFMGRVTFQKGPLYFVQAAKLVLDKVPNCRFILAGTGNMLEEAIYQVKQLGMEDKFSFPGFLNGIEMQEIFKTVSVFVMPSVSEPFGIAALEAVNFGVPVIISKQSGVSEVLRNTLQFDFWDKISFADMIVNSLDHPELRQELVYNSQKEVSGITWEIAGAKVKEIYRKLV